MNTISPTLTNCQQQFESKRGHCSHHVAITLTKKFQYQKKIRIPLSYLVKATGYSERQIQRAIQWLEDIKFIRVLRDIYDVNIYYLTDFYRDPKVFHKMLKYLTGWVIFSTSLLVQQSHVVLSINNGSYIINPSVTVSNVKPQKGRGGIGEHTLTILKIEREEVMSIKEWGSAIKELHAKFPLTDHGIAKLSAFPAEVIRYLITILPMVYKAHDPFAFVVFKCKTYCTEKGIAPDWDQARKLMALHNTTPESPCVDIQALQHIISDEEQSTKTQYQKGDMLQKHPYHGSYFQCKVEQPKSKWLMGLKDNDEAVRFRLDYIAKYEKDGNDFEKIMVDCYKEELKNFVEGI